MAIGSTALDYRNILIKLAPSGPCWSTDPNSNWVKLLDGIAQEFARIDGRSIDLVNEAFPDTSTELLENWERVVGLPDLFSDPAATLQERRNAVMFKLQARGGQSTEYIQGLIESLGYSNTTVDAFAFAADIGCADGYLFDDAWLHYFVVIVHDSVPNRTLFEARVRSIQPAQAVSVFIYDEDYI